MRNVFCEKQHAKCGGKTSPRPFYKTVKIENISELTAWNVMNLFLLYVQVEIHQNILKLSC